MVKNKFTYVCRACHKQFVREHAYLEHECKQLKREKELKTPNGQTAWHYYQTWMRQKKRMPPSAESFIASKYFRTFINFVVFSKKVQLPLPKTFIWWMNKRDLPPTIWTCDDVYTQYLEFVDNQMDPMARVNASVDTILKFTDACDVDPSEFFDIIDSNELIHLIRLRKLSPWILLFSNKFRETFANMNDEQKAIMETLINPDHWQERMQNFVDEIKTIKMYINQLGI